MKQVILIHGLPSKEEVTGDVWPSPSNCHWFPWIQKQLTKEDLLCQALEMSRSYNPNYSDHEKVLNQMSISNETVLVAPWVDPENYLKELNPESDYFNFKIDPTITTRTEVHCIYSTDDEDYILDSIKIIEEHVTNMQMHVFTDKGHFTEPDLGTKEFPELLDLFK